MNRAHGDSCPNNQLVSSTGNRLISGGGFFVEAVFVPPLFVLDNYLGKPVLANIPFSRQIKLSQVLTIGTMDAYDSLQRAGKQKPQFARTFFATINKRGHKIYSMQKTKERNINTN